MRLAGQVKGGFYAAPPEAVKLAAQRIRYTSGPILDPCAGEGEAIDLLAKGMQVPPDQVHAIELEADRANRVRERLPEATVLGPCSCFDTKISHGSFAVVWCNPPFDDNVKGGRTEPDFLRRSIQLLAPGGVVLLILPEPQVESEYQSVPRLLWEHCEELAILKFPADHRPFREVACIGRKRRNHLPALLERRQWQRDVVRGSLDTSPLEWEPVALSGKPKSFAKAGLTDAELVESVAKSPLWKLTQNPDVRQPARPPLPLSKGHIALLLASGQLDGVVQKEGEPPHVVRGTATKVACLPEVAQEVLPNGAVKTITTVKERIQLVVRAVGPDGRIRTFE